jgi:hypothetical protein
LIKTAAHLIKTIFVLIKMFRAADESVSGGSVPALASAREIMSRETD